MGVQIGFYHGRNPIAMFARNYLLKKIYGHQQLRAIQNYTFSFESTFAKNVYSTENTSTRLNLLYMNIWLLEYHITKQGHTMRLLSLTRLQNYLKLRKIVFLTGMLIKTEHVQLYTNEFDEQIHDELRRMYQITRHTFNAFFVFPRRVSPQEADQQNEKRDKQLTEIIEQMVLRQQDPKADQIVKYFLRSMEEDFKSFMLKMEDIQIVESPSKV